MRGLLNKHAIITGGSRGIGLAIAQRFASEGAAVTLVGRDEARLRSAVEGLPPRSPESEELKHGFHAFDVSNMVGWEEMMKKMKDVSMLLKGVTSLPQLISRVLFAVKTNNRCTCQRSRRNTRLLAFSGGSCRISTNCQH